jgi:hypothetical protein
MVQYLAGKMIPPTGGWGNAYSNGNCNINEAALRESAYGFDVMLTMDKLGVTPPDPAGTASYATWAAREQFCVDVLIGSLDEYTNGTGRYAEHQYFIDGLAMDPLIKWWQRTKDPRIPMVIKPLLDQYWSNYNGTSHIPMWNPDANTTIHCADATSWYIAVFDDHCQETTHANNNDLINLFIHAFAWYWRISGDDTYRTEGDELFSHAFDNPAWTGLGKTWSQNFDFSFNYVGWRQGWLSPEKSIQ